MDITQYEIEITTHAIMRAYQRGIEPDIIYKIVRGGKRIDFGKDYAKWEMNYKNKKILCIGQIKNLKIWIFTITIK